MNSVYNNPPEAGEVHAAELESMNFAAERRLTGPAGNVKGVVSLFVKNNSGALGKSSPMIWDPSSEEAKFVWQNGSTDELLPRWRDAAKDTKRSDSVTKALKVESLTQKLQPDTRGDEVQRLQTFVDSHHHSSFVN